MVKTVVLIAPPANIGVSKWLGVDTSFLSCLRAAFLGYNSRSFIGENLGLHCVAASLSKVGAEVTVIDACLRELSIGQVVHQVIDSGCDVVGIICLEDLLDEVHLLVEQLRKHDFKGRIIIGGPLAILAPHLIMERFSFPVEVFSGDGDAFTDYLSPSYAKKRKSATSYDHRLWPNRSDTKVAVREQFAAGISSSKGCSYGKCAFCTLASLSNRLNYGWTCRPSGDVVEEFSLIANNLNPEWITFADEDFIGPLKRGGPERAKEIADHLIRSGNDVKWMIDCRIDQINYELFSRLRDAGLSRVFVGIEHCSKESLQNLKKGISPPMIRQSIEILSRLSIEMIPGYIQFVPWEDPFQTLDSFRFYRSLGYYELGKGTTALRPYAGTEFCNNHSYAFEAPWYKDILIQASRFTKVAMQVYIEWTRNYEAVPRYLIPQLSDCHHDLIESLICLYTPSKRQLNVETSELEGLVSDSITKLLAIQERHNSSTTC